MVIFGAKSLALGAYYALSEINEDETIDCFVVSSLNNNVSTLAGKPVRVLTDITDKNVRIYIATPEDTHPTIIQYLQENHFDNYVCMDSKEESRIMSEYYRKKQIFPLLEDLEMGNKKARLQVYQAKFWKDKALIGKYVCPEWIIPIQVGAALIEQRVTDITDDLGDNISSKNVNYCELTALYWLWKNGINNGELDAYYGTCHYRRILNINDDDLYRIKSNDVDVVLPLPTMYEPNAYEHHERYIKESDWKAVEQALKEIQPEYYNQMGYIFENKYLYNYNIFIAKKSVLDEYCKWLFPILERVETISEPRGCERADRYIGYIAENLLSLYFMVNIKKYKIVHTGRYMLI